MNKEKAKVNKMMKEQERKLLRKKGPIDPRKALLAKTLPVHQIFDSGDWSVGKKTGGISTVESLKMKSNSKFANEMEKHRANFKKSKGKK